MIRGGGSARICPYLWTTKSSALLPRQAGRPGDARPLTETPVLYDSARPRHPRRDRRHDRQRQDRPRHRAHRRGGDGRHAGARHRSEGRSRAICCSRSPTLAAGGVRAVGQPDEARRAGTTPRRLPSSEARALERGPRGMGAGRRAHRAAAKPRPTSRSTRRAAAPGVPLSILRSFKAPPRGS